MFYKFINLVKINLKYKKKFFFYKLNKKDMAVIKILIKYNIIKFVQKIQNNNFIVFLNYKNNKNIFEITNLYKPSSKKIINIREINKITNKKNSIFILSSSKGIITNIEAFKKKVGGILILKLSLKN